MKRHKYYLKNLENSDARNIQLDENFYKEISHDWQKKAQDLQNRRWQKLHNAELDI